LILVEIDAQAALGQLGRTVAAAGDRTVPNRQLAVQLQAWVFRNFQQGGTLQTPSWPPLSPATLAQKAKEGYSGTPLIRTGHLRQSFRGFSDNETAGVRSEVPYAQFHESGTGTLPQRAMLPSQTVALDYARRIYDRWTQQIARSA